MKNSYRIYPVYGTSALKYEDPSKLENWNIVRFPASMQVDRNHRNSLRIQREIPKASFKAKVEMALSFAACYIFCLGVALSMV